MSAKVLTGDNEKQQPIAYRTRKGPIASNAFLSCRLDRGDIARQFYKPCPSFHEAYHGKIGGLVRSVSENPLTLG